MAAAVGQGRERRRRTSRPATKQPFSLTQGPRRSHLCSSSSHHASTSISIPRRLAGLQRKGNPFLCPAFARKGEKRLGGQAGNGSYGGSCGRGRRTHACSPCAG